MKKRILALALCAVTAVGMTACGNSKGETAEATESVETTETPAVNLAKYDLNGEDYVKLCDYNAIPITITGDYEVTDEDEKTFFEQWFESSGPFYREDTSKTVVEEGDIVNVDYVGKLDGEAFQNGTAQNQNIDVSNNCAAGGGSGYIDGFTDDLLGAKVGDVIDSDVTFPEEYNNADLAGKEVVFTFTVNSIQRELTLDEVDDEFASDEFGVDTVEEMHQEIKTYLEDSASSSRTSDIYAALQNYLLENCQVDMPEDYCADVIEAVRNNFIQNYCAGDEANMETMVKSYGYDSVEALEKEWESSVKNSIQLELIVKAIAAKENIKLEDSDFDNYVQNIVSGNGYGSTENLYSRYGYGDVTYGENQVRAVLLAREVLDHLSESAKITEQPAEDTESAEGTEAVESTEIIDATEEEN